MTPDLGGVLEARLALDDDQRADAVRGERGGGAGETMAATRVCVRGGTRRCHDPAQRADAPDALQRPAQLRLEDDDERQQADHGAGLEDRGEEPQVERLGDHVDDVQQDRADHEPDRAGALDQAEQAVDQEGGEGDIEQ